MLPPHPHVWYEICVKQDNGSGTETCPLITEDQNERRRLTEEDIRGKT